MVDYTYQNFDETRHEYCFDHETMFSVLFSLPENEAISFCYGLCDVTLIQLKCQSTAFCIMWLDDSSKSPLY